MSDVFVTGGSGFIGGRLIERLCADGHAVRALARSSAAAERVHACGAEAIRGELADVAAMRTGAEGCELAFHAAATLGDWGRREDFERGNVQGTGNVLEACADAGVRRLVHVSTEAVLIAGEPLVDVDETAPLRPDSPALYSATKARAEQAVLAANGRALETVVLRPRFVWGLGDTTLLPRMVELARSGRFAWIDGGRQLTATTHVENTVEGLVRAAAQGVRQLAARNPGCRRANAQRPASARLSPRDRRRGNLAAAAAPRRASADPLHLLGVLAGVHDQDRQGARSARLRARQDRRRRPRRDARRVGTQPHPGPASRRHSPRAPSRR